MAEKKESCKEQILKFLEENKGSSISGNEIAQKLSVSRSAVWKAVKSLQESGYQIHAANKKGYCLSLENDILSSQSIRPFIKDNKAYPLIEVYDELASTNNTAKERAIAGALDGTVIIAEHQTSGKGRLGRTFYSPKSSGIYMTPIFRPTGRIEDSLLITAAASVAVCRAIASVTGIEAQIKWVNDIYVKGKKVCGILTEASMNFETASLDYLIIGIGINILENSFPPEISNTAASLSQFLPSQAISRSHLIAAVLNELQIVIRELPEKKFLEEYRSRSCILGSKINVITQQATEPAAAVSINNQGHLVVKMESGEMRTLNSGEISIRKRNDLD